MPRVLIAGCGYVGAATADLFQAAGWEVEGWTRSPESAARFAAKPYSVHAVDIADRSAVQAARGAFDVGDPLRQLRRRRDAESYRRIYLEGAQKSSRGIASRADSFTRAAHQFTPRPTADGSTRRARPNQFMKRARSCAKPKNSSGKMAAWWRAWPGSMGPVAPRFCANFFPARRASITAASGT